MSEYITIETESTDDPDELLIMTNQPLALEGIEVYPDAASGDEGSPLAQALFALEGILALTIDDHDLIVRRDPETPWFALIDAIQSALKDFFL